MLKSREPNIGSHESEAGVRSELFRVAPVSSFWLSRLSDIDAQWNPRSWSEKLFSQELDNPRAVVRGLFADETLIGYLIAHVVMDEAHIVAFGIDSAWRRRGGGAYLLQEFLRRARLESVAIVTLEVRTSNAEALRLYARCGFQIVGVRPRFYSSNGEDGISMRCELFASG